MAGYLPWLTFIIGILVGWLLTWLIMIGDRRDLEGKVAELEASLLARENELHILREQAITVMADLETVQAELDARQANMETLAAELAARSRELEACTADLAIATEQLSIRETPEAPQIRSAAVVQVSEVDDFTQIKGIGPAIAARLSAVGFHHYADLAAADADDLPNALGLRSWQKVDPASWIAEAAVLAGRPAQVHVGDDLTLLEGIGPAYATRLRAAGISSYGDLAAAKESTLAEIIGAPSWRRASYADWITQAQLAADGDEAELKALQETLFKRQGDNLTLIAGIGPESLIVLQDAGLDNFAALAAATPEQLADLFSAADARAGDFDAWIAEAKLRAAGKRVKRTRTRPPELQGTESRSCPQDLEEIYGIGTVYEQRLYDVGIGTFWEAGMLPEDALSEILEVEEFQDVDLAALKADALRLAEETETMGHTWDGTEPDNFEPLEGIGPVLERRLYAAGICSFETLAAATAEFLEEVCHPPAFQNPNFARWIIQAKERLS